MTTKTITKPVYEINFTEQESALETLLTKINEFNDDTSPCETCGGCWCDTCEFGGENDDED